VDKKRKFISPNEKKVRPSNLSNYSWFLLIVYISGCYINSSLHITKSFFIPYVISNISGLLLFVLNFNEFLQSRKIHLFCSGILFISILSIVFSPNNYVGILKEEILSLAQLLLSLVGSVGVYLTIIKAPPQKIKTIFKLFLFLLLIGGLLERLLPFFKELSDSFRYIAYDSGIYLNDKRDIFENGFIRPKFFSREPSHYSHYLVIFTLFWYMCSKNSKKLIIAFLLLIIEGLISGSPKILVLIPLILISDISFLKKSYIKYRIYFPIIGFFLVLIFCFGVFVSGAWHVFTNRITLIISGTDISFYLRIIFPIVLLFQTVELYPVFGIGLGGKENIWEVMRNIIFSKGGYYRFMTDDNILNLFHNFTVSAVIYYGALGSIFLVFTFNKTLIVQFNRNEKFIFWITIIIFGLLGSPYVSHRTWMVIMFFISLFATANSRKNTFDV